MTPPRDKLHAVRDQGTAGVNVGLDNHDILAKLADWDARFGIEISEAGPDRVMVRLASLPEDLDRFVEEVYRFCPDVVDQHFAALWCGYTRAAPPPPDVAELLGDLDPDAEGYGLEILKRWLRRERTLPLWWD